MSRRIAAALMVLVCTLPQTALGEELTWSEEWPEFRISEGIVTGVSFAGGAALNYGLGSPEHGRWRGPILLDRPVRRAFAAESTPVADGYGLASDIFTGTLMAYPFVVDAGAVAFGGHRAAKPALQIALIGAESFAVSTFLMTAGKHLVARERPPSPDCSREGDHNLYCSHERFESFPSGHTTYAFTGASFICAVHENVELYGSYWADRAACWGALAVATGSGVSRIVSDNHYLSDVAAGAALGFASGYLLPKFLHFGWGSSSERAGIRPVVLPAGRGIRIGATF